MSLPTALWPKWKIWHWVTAVAAFLFWTSAMKNWIHGAFLSGRDLLIVYSIWFFVYLSPLFACASAAWSVRRFRQNRVDRLTLSWRLGWALALVLNYVAVLWKDGVFT